MSNAMLHKSMDMDKYQAMTTHLSKTMLSVLADCPAKFKHQFIDLGATKEETKSLRIGKAVHTLAMEPEKWEDEYALFDGDRRTTAGKSAYAELLDEGKTIIRADEMKQIDGMANAIVKHNVANALLKSSGHVEASITWHQDGLDFKCRPDFMRNDGLIVDLKTSKSAKPSQFAKDAYNYKYFLSVALTSAGYEALHGKPPEEYVMLVIETEAPYCISAFTTFTSFSTMSVLEYGKMRLAELIGAYKTCLTNNEWPEYQRTIEPLRLPTYATTGE